MIQKRPKLNQIDLKKALAGLLQGEQGFCVTMSPGQWDVFLEVGYERNGATLIEIGSDGSPVSAYKKTSDNENI